MNVRAIHLLARNRCGVLRAPVRGPILRFIVKWEPRQLQRHRKQNGLESPTIDGDSPVCKSESPALFPAYQSSTELVELCVKPGGPPSKAKYYSTTDSEK